MKSFAIFPTISIFILTFSLLRSQWEFEARKNLLWTMLLTIVLGGLLAYFSTELNIMLMLSNFVFALALVPFLTFLINDIFPTVTGRTLWIRLFGIGLVAIALTLTLLGASMFFALANNPMDPGPK